MILSFTHSLRRAVRSICYGPQIRNQSNIFHDLSGRGFIQQTTSSTELEDALRSRQVVYCGVDPSAAFLAHRKSCSFDVLVAFPTSRAYNYSTCGATGLIGDPSGRKTEREQANATHVEKNVNMLSDSIKTFFHRGLAYAESRLPSASESIFDPEVKNNLEWHNNFTMLEFLRVVGVHARINTMLSKESVKTRLESSAGISFTEFTYQLLQAYDFYHLHRAFGCTIQIGGSDQWGNIVAGLEFINRLSPSKPSKDDQKAFGITTPLLTTASGEKFGKSAGNAIWLNPQLTSIFDFFQYFLKVEDADVEKYLKVFTFLSLEEIEVIMKIHKLEPDKRSAQRRLAAEVTELVHGVQGVKRAEMITNTVFRHPNAKSHMLDADSLIDAFTDDPRMSWCQESELTSVPVMKLASKYGLVPSTSAARQLIQSKGLYFNDHIVPDTHFTMNKTHLLDGRAVMIRAGKDKVILLATPHS